jgi:hypothetical protein
LIVLRHERDVRDIGKDRHLELVTQPSKTDERSCADSSVVVSFGHVHGHGHAVDLVVAWRAAFHVLSLQMCIGFVLLLSCAVLVLWDWQGISAVQANDDQFNTYNILFKLRMKMRKKKMTGRTNNLDFIPYNTLLFF